MMFLFFVLPWLLLAMVSMATGNIEMTTTQMAPVVETVVETVPHPTPSLSAANFLVNGDKSVPLKLTTVTYINAKNSTTVVPVLTLSTSVDEIVEQSIVILTVPAGHVVSETTSSPSPSVSATLTPSTSSSSSQTSSDEPSPFIFASGEHNGVGGPTSSSQLQPGPVTIHPTVVLSMSASKKPSTSSSTSSTGHGGGITVSLTINAQVDPSSSISSTTTTASSSSKLQQGPGTQYFTVVSTESAKPDVVVVGPKTSATPEIIVVEPKESTRRNPSTQFITVVSTQSVKPDIVVVQPKESSQLEPTTQFVTVVATQTVKPDVVVVQPKESTESTAVVTEIVKPTVMVTVFSTSTNFITRTAHHTTVVVTVANPYPFGVGRSHTPATYHGHDAADGDPGGLEWAQGVHTNPKDLSVLFPQGKPPVWPTAGAVGQVMEVVVPWVTGHLEEVKGTGAVATILPVTEEEEVLKAAETPVEAARAATPAVDVLAQATPTSLSAVDFTFTTARAQGAAVGAQAGTVDADDAQEKPTSSLQARDWNAPEQTRRFNAPNKWTTLHGTRQPAKPTNGPPLTRGINWDPFGGATTLTGTRKPSTLTHGRRMGKDQNGLDPRGIPASNTLSTSTSTSAALPHVPGAEASSALMENSNNKDEKTHLLLMSDGFWDGLKHVICFFNVYCDDDATEKWKEGKAAFESQLGGWILDIEPTAAAAAMADLPKTLDPPPMTITSFASVPRPTSTAAASKSESHAAGVTAPALHQDLAPVAKRSEDKDEKTHLLLMSDGFWDDVKKGAKNFWCWMLPFTCHK